MNKNASIASGAHPGQTFPNTHLLKPSIGPSESAQSPASWAAPRLGQGAVAELRQAVCSEDWAGLYAEGKTKQEVHAEWGACVERTAALNTLLSISGAQRVLEVGAFCGVATLAMAEVMPDGGEVVSIELDPFLVEFANSHFKKSPANSRIRSLVGPAKQHLESLVQEVQMGSCNAFDFVVIDADKQLMDQYFDLVWNTPGMLGTDAIVCVDTTPFKGQAPKRFLRFGHEDKWVSDSGQSDIDSFRARIAALHEVESNEFAGMLVLKKK